MQTNNPEFWNQLYEPSQYMFGEEPNAYLKSKIADLKPGKVLLPGDGEGRNAVYCAGLGWEVSAFDLSEVGKLKADELAEKNHVQIDFKVGDVEELTYEKESFDVLVSIFCHFMPEQRRHYHQILTSYLKPKGALILEGFSRPAGIGADIRFDLEELKEDFKEFDFVECRTEIVNSNEGFVIRGRNEVVRIFAFKK